MDDVTGPQNQQRIAESDAFGRRFEGDYAELASEVVPSQAVAAVITDEALARTTHLRIRRDPADLLARDVATALKRHLRSGVVEVDVVETEAPTDAALHVTGETTLWRAGVSIRVGSIANLRTDRLARHIELQMQLADAFDRSSGVLWFDDGHWSNQPTQLERSKRREVCLPISAVTSGLGVVVPDGRTVPSLVGAIDPRDGARVEHVRQFVQGFIGTSGSAKLNNYLYTAVVKLAMDFDVRPIFDLVKRDSRLEKAAEAFDTLVSVPQVRDQVTAEFGRTYDDGAEFLTAALTQWFVLEYAPIEPSAERPTMQVGPIALRLRRHFSTDSQLSR